MLDLCLIELPNLALENPKMYMPLGNLYLASMARNAGYSVQIMDFRQAVGQMPKARFYGFSCTTPQMTVGEQLAKRVKGITIAGGAHPSLLPEDCAGKYDYIVRGEGEYILLDIMAGKYEGGVITAPRIKDLDALPLPAWDMVEDGFSTSLYTGERYGFGARSMAVITSRGCPYACAFCLPKGTLILMSDMRQTPIENVNIGDKIIGVKQSNGRYRYIEGEVLNTSKRKGLVYAIETEDGIVYSTEEHPWLMRNKFLSVNDIFASTKHNGKIASERHSLRKLTVASATPMITDDFRKGYLSGAIMGDGCCRIKKHTRDYGKGEYSYRNVSIVGDYEMLDRCLEFSKDIGLPLHGRKFNGGKFYRCNRSVVADKSKIADGLYSLFKVPRYDIEYIRGFLSGIYDAEGSFSGSLRISQNDNNTKKLIAEYLYRVGFSFVLERKGLRLKGGLSEVVRFLSWCNPAVIHKYSNLISKQVHSSVKIKSIYPINNTKPIEVYNLTTTCETFVADGFITHNCGNVHTKLVFFRSVENIRKELIELMKHDVYHYRFVDDNFTIHPEFNKLCKELKQLGIKYRCHTRSNLIDEHRAVAMKESGCEECSLGVESADDKVLKLNNKKETVAQHAKAVQVLKDTGLAPKIYWMSGLPGETDETIELNMEFMRQYKPNKWTLSTFTPYPGCDIFNNPDRYGVEITNRHWHTWWNFVFPHDRPLPGREGYNHVLIGQTQEQMKERHDRFYRFLREESWK